MRPSNGTKNVYTQLSFLLISLYSIYSVIYIFFGEKIPANGGLGYDGQLYGWAVKDLINILQNHLINSYHLQKFLPSAIIHYALQLLNFELTNENIVKAFGIYNFILAVGAIVLWFKIAAKKNLSQKLSFIGLVFIIINFPALKFNLYYPVLTDGTGLFLGFLTLYAFVIKNNFFLFLCTLIGSFSWPIVLFAIPFLQIFPFNKLPVRTSNTRFNIIAFAIAIIAMDSVIYYFFVHIPRMMVIGGDNGYYTRMAPLHLQHLNLIAGVICMNLYFMGCWYNLLKYDIKQNILLLLKSVNFFWLILCAALFVMVKYYCSFFPVNPDSSFRNYFLGSYTASCIQPFAALVTHSMYYGPVIFLVILHWKKIWQKSEEWGIGFLLFFMINILQIADAESRHLIFFFPFVLLLLLLSLDENKFTGKYMLLIICVALLFSKVWFQINTDAYVYSVLNDSDFTKEIQQRYFMHQGYFMSYKYYLVQVPFVFGCGALIYFLFNKKADRKLKEKF